MKRIVIILATVVISVASAQAQEAFKHLSLGIDVGTTGIGAQLALPIASDHLVLTAGYNYGSYSTAIDPQNGLDLSSVSAEVNGYVNEANRYLAKLPDEDASFVILPNYSDVEGNGSINLGTVKAILEFYPFKKSGFHISAGAYYGSADILQVDAILTDYWEVYKADSQVAQLMKAKYPEYSAQVGDIPELKANLCGHVYEVKDDGNLNAGFEVAKLRPYVGLGFGRSVPKSRFGFQFDLGAIYTGKITINSTNETTGPCDVTISNGTADQIFDLADRFRIYPQLTFRLIYRIF